MATVLAPGGMDDVGGSWGAPVAEDQKMMDAGEPETGEISED